MSLCCNRISGRHVGAVNIAVDCILDGLKPIDVIADHVSDRGNLLAGQVSLENIPRHELQILNGQFVNDICRSGFHKFS